MSKFKINTLVLKVASRCNLNCTYCYMYNKGDMSYLKQPKFMSREVVDALINNTLQHCREHQIRRFNFVFHGGEPLLCSPEFYYYFVQKANSVLGPEGIKGVYQMQTNALLLSPEWCRVLNELGIIVGISLDGRKEDNDRQRIDHRGEGSYDRIIRGLRIGQEHLKIAPGLLCVINIDANPRDAYNHFKELGVKSGDFLIPYATNDLPPDQPTNPENISATPYADWLIKIFDQWYEEPNGERLNLRIFPTIIRLILGTNHSADNFGNANNEVLLIETDGGLEPVGALKLCGDSFTKAGANVLTHTFDEALITELAMRYITSHTNKPEPCNKCLLTEVCGGGHIAHRYSKANGFNNVSVYCRDFMKLITHIQNRIVDGFPADYVNNYGIEKITFSEAEAYLKQLQLPADIYASKQV